MLKTKNNLFIKYLLVIIIAIIIFPLITAFLFEGSSFTQKLLNSYKFHELSIIICAALGLFLFLAKKKFKIKKIKKKDKEKKEIKLRIFLMIISIILILISINAYSEINSFLSKDISLDKNNENKLLIDNEMWLNIPILENKLLLDEIFINGFDSENKEFKKTIYLKKIPANPQIEWFGSWHGNLFNDNVFNPNVEIFLKINDKNYNVSKQYSALKEFEQVLIIQNISTKDLVIGLNNVSIFITNKGGIGEDIGVLTLKDFDNDNSYIKNQDEFLKLESQEFLIFIKEDSSFLNKIVFKLSFIFKILSLILLILAIFGLQIFKENFSEVKLELLFSFVISYLIGLFYIFSNNAEKVISELTTFIVYLLLRITTFPAGISLNMNESSIILNEFKANVAADSSGVSHMFLFLIAFNIILITMWDDIKFKKSLKFQIIGLIGIFLLNAISIYLQTLMKYFKLEKLNSLTEYIPIILFMIFFVFFWDYVLKRISKNEKE